MREEPTGIELERAHEGDCNDGRQSEPRIAVLPFVLLFATLFIMTSPRIAGQVRSGVDAAELQLELDKLQHLGSVLYVGAHPDDENTALLAYLARGCLARTAYLSITRGDGGQNLIGAEIGERLGLIRTQELLQARRQDGAEQFFTRAIDFGYTKSVDETLAVWGREEILGDVVRVIRRFRPDVIITRFPGDGRGGHGQHTASAVLAFDAFSAAADPARFPEQLAEEGLEVWQAKRLLWDAFRFFGRDTEPPAPNEIVLDIGEYKPLLGESFGEIAARSRTMHKSQGFGSAPRRGAQPGHLEHRLGEQATADLFDGVDTSWNRLAGGETVGRLLAEARRRYDPARPEAVVSLLMEAWSALAELPPSPWVEVKRSELREVIRAAAGLWLEVSAERPTASPSEGVELTAEVVNRSELPFRFAVLRLPFEAAAQQVDLELPRNETVTIRRSVRVPADERPTQPYWLESEPTAGRYEVDETSLIGQPEDLPYRAVLDLTLDGGELSFELPVLYRWTDRVDGVRYRPFVVTPPLLLETEESVHLFPDTPRARAFGVLVRRPEGPADAPLAGSVRLVLPAGWQATPAEVPFSLAAGATERLELQVTPPEGAAAGSVRAEAVLDGGRTTVLSRGMATIEYSHIPTQVLFPPAEARLVRLELQTAKRRLGYVMGAGDDVPEALRGIGYEVVLLDDEQLATGELGEYETIVVGVRAYNVRAALREHNDRLLDYVAGGGTLVVQYNTAPRGAELDGIGPYPFSLSRERVSVETAPVVLVDPDQPILQRPNRIVNADFDGWVQERGLYFAGTWDEHFSPLLASHDPGEPNRLGGLLVARHGRGIYVYTGYSFFRQLPAGVPGAFRLFVNLIEAGGQS